MGGKEAEAADFGGNVFADGPGQAEPVVSRRAYTRAPCISDSLADHRYERLTHLVLVHR